MSARTNDVGARAVFFILAEGVSAGLPVPMAVHVWDHYDGVQLRLIDNDTAGVDRWSAWLAMPAAQAGETVFADERGRPPWRSYKSGAAIGSALQRVPGWRVEVWCAQDLSAEAAAALGDRDPDPV